MCATNNNGSRLYSTPTTQALTRGTLASDKPVKQKKVKRKGKQKVHPWSHSWKTR